MKKALVAAGLLIAGLAAAREIVDQGSPGLYGPWPVTVSGGIVINVDGGLNVNATPPPDLTATGTIFSFPDGGGGNQCVTLGPINGQGSIAVQAVSDGGSWSAGRIVLQVSVDGSTWATVQGTDLGSLAMGTIIDFSQANDVVAVNATGSVRNFRACGQGGSTVVGTTTVNIRASAVPNALDVAVAGGVTAFVTQSTTPWIDFLTDATGTPFPQGQPVNPAATVSGTYGEVLCNVNASAVLIGGLSGRKSIAINNI